jgi:hypothetical protein
MLDLVVQPPTEVEVDDTATADVARRRNLPTYVVGLVGRRQDRHAFVIRGERGAHVHAEQSLLHPEKCERLPRREDQQQRGEVGDGMGGKQGRSIRRGCRRRVPSTSEPTLTTRRLIPSRSSIGKNSPDCCASATGRALTCAMCLRPGEDQCAGGDIRVGAFGVGVDVVAAVLVLPTKRRTARRAGCRARIRLGRWRGGSRRPAGARRRGPETRRG